MDMDFLKRIYIHPPCANEDVVYTRHTPVGNIKYESARAPYSAAHLGTRHATRKRSMMPQNAKQGCCQLFQ